MLLPYKLCSSSNNWHQLRTFTSGDATPVLDLLLSLIVPKTNRHQIAEANAPKWSKTFDFKLTSPLKID